MNSSDDNTIEMRVSDIFTPITPHREIVGMRDDIRMGEEKKYVSAFIEKEGHLLVVKIENCRYLLPRGVISKGETPKDALFRILRTKHNLDVEIGEAVNLPKTQLPIEFIDDWCYRVTLKGDIAPQEHMLTSVQYKKPN